MKDSTSQQWPTKRLGDIALVASGGTPLKSEPTFWDGEIPWYSSGELNADFTADPKSKITQKGLDKSNAKIFPPGSLLIGMYDTAAMKMSLLDRHAAFNQAVAGARPGDGFDLKFIKAMLEAIKPEILDQRRGTRQKNLSLEKIKNIRVPVPPFDEQKRIVAMLDQAFAALDRARAHAEANLADCRKLFAVAVSALVKRKSNNEQRRLRLGSIVTRLTNGYVGPISDVYVETGIPYLLARQVRDNTLAFDGRTYVTQEFNDKHKKSKLKAGDVLLVQSGHIGNSAVVPTEHEGHNCHAMIVITSVEEIVSGSYLSALFNTPEMQDAFQNIRTGSTVPHLTCKMVKELMIELPPRRVQDEIIEEIENLKGRIEIAKQRYKTDAADLADLRQSLLQKAFSGQLT